MHERVDEGLYLVRGKRSNMYLLTGRCLLLIDGGMPGDEAAVFATLEQRGYSPGDLKYIFITHGHLDHVGGLAALKSATGARIVAGRDDKDPIEGKRMLCSMKREGFTGQIFKIILYVMERFAIGYDPVDVDMACTGGEFIEGLRIIATPGHSPGSLSFFQEEKRWLFTGDALSGTSELRLPPRAGCSNYRQALTSVKKIGELDCSAYLFGHGACLRGATGPRIHRLLKEEKGGAPENQ